MGQVSEAWNPLSKTRVKQILETRILKTFREDFEAYLIQRNNVDEFSIDISVRGLLKTRFSHTETVLKWYRNLHRRKKLAELKWKNSEDERELKYPGSPCLPQPYHQLLKFSNSQRFIDSRLHLEAQRTKICSLLKFCLPQKNHILVNKFHKSIHPKTIFEHLLIIQNLL